MNPIAAPMPPVGGKDRFRGSAAGAGRGDLDSRLARSARAGPVNADKGAEHRLGVAGSWHPCQ